MAADPELLNLTREVFPSLESLFAAGEDVRAVVDSPGWEAVGILVGMLERKEQRTLDAAREPLTQAEYAMAHGRLHGFRATQRAAEAILEVYGRRLREQSEKHERAGESALEVT